jgi:hypothetical protein
MTQGNSGKATIFLWPDEQLGRVHLVTVVDDLASTSSYSTGDTAQNDLLTLDRKLRKKGYKNIVYGKPESGILESIPSHPEIPL